MKKVNIKDTVKNLAIDTKNVYKNTIDLIDSAALLIVSGFSFMFASGHIKSMSVVGQKTVLIASVIIGLQGAYYLWQALADKK